MKFLLALIIFVTSFPIIPNVNSNKNELASLIYNDMGIINENELGGLLSEDAITNVNTINNYDSFTQFDTYLEAYYRGLTDNFGDNVFGSCNYVAACMILSYYDTYLSDVFIPENYDVNTFSFGTNMIDERESPGVVFDDPTASLEATGGNSDFDTYTLEQCLQIYEFFSESNNTFTTPSLHAKLILMADDLNMSNPNNYSTLSQGNLLENNILNLKQVLEVYFEEQGLLNNVTLNYYNGGTSSVDGRTNNIKQFIKSQIDLGKPVVVMGFQNYDNKYENGHAFVCYDYDENYIYGHMGWKNDNTHDYTYYPVEFLYPYFTEAMTLNTNMLHSHTNNYVISPNITCCYDDCRILTFNPDGVIHQHNNIISSADDIGHYDNCIRCNTVLFVGAHSHNSVFVEFTADGHYDSCAFCGIKLFHSNHSYIVDDYSFICNNNGHQYNCAICNGYPIYESHDFMPNYVEYYDDGHYGVCLTSMQLVWMSDHYYQYAYTEGGYDYFYCACGRYYRTPTPTG